MRGQCLHGVDQGVADLLGGATVRQVHEHHVAGGAFDQGADRGRTVLADDQIAFPVAGDRPVLGRGGPFADHHHRAEEPRLAPVRVAAGFAHGAAGAQRAGQFTAQLATSLDIEGLVDRLVDHVPLRPVGMLPSQHRRDLLGTAFTAQMILHDAMQLGIGRELAGLGPWPAGIGTSLRGVGPVLAVARMAVAADLPADRGRAAAQLGRDLPDRGLLPQPVGDVDAVVLTEIPRGRRRRLPVFGLIPTSRHAFSSLTPCCTSRKYSARSATSLHGP
ncbi:hypothetical protein LX90_006128 [Lentzea flava]|nr:hypothetical protein [Lentzea flava]